MINIFIGIVIAIFIVAVVFCIRMAVKSVSNENNTSNMRKTYNWAIFESVSEICETLTKKQDWNVISISATSDNTTHYVVFYYYYDD